MYSIDSSSACQAPEQYLEVQMFSEQEMKSTTQKEKRMSVKRHRGLAAVQKLKPPSKEASKNPAWMKVRLSDSRLKQKHKLWGFTVWSACWGFAPKTCWFLSLSFTQKLSKVLCKSESNSTGLTNYSALCVCKCNSVYWGCVNLASPTQWGIARCSHRQIPIKDGCVCVCV